MNPYTEDNSPYAGMDAQGLCTFQHTRKASELPGRQRGVGHGAPTALLELLSGGTPRRVQHMKGMV